MKPVKYILILTVILFVFVFLVTLPGTIRKNKNNSETTTSQVSETSDNTDNILISDGSDEMSIDNQWALFLVNKENPLPDDYEVTTHEVQSEGSFLMDTRCSTYMISMLEAAANDGIHIHITSAYRTKEYQQKLFDNDVANSVASGLTIDEAKAEALKQLGLPGCSEHNAGIAADIVEAGQFTLSEKFAETPEYQWLQENAADYGFILRYPEGKENITGIIFEPWHYRFVGIYHAKKIKQSGLTLEEFIKAYNNK